MPVLVVFFIIAFGLPLSAAVATVIGIAPAVKTFLGIAAIVAFAGFKVSRKEFRNGSS